MEAPVACEQHKIETEIKRNLQHDGELWQRPCYLSYYTNAKDSPYHLSAIVKTFSHFTNIYHSTGTKSSQTTACALTDLKCLYNFIHISYKCLFSLPKSQQLEFSHGDQED
jgi:hypothetical protein